MDWISRILGIMTIASTLFGAISIYDARKSKKELNKYTYLFDLAEKNIDKNLTLDELNRLREEKQAMDKVIKEEIPRQARITVLYDRLKADEEYLSQSYNRYKQTQEEFQKLQQEEKIQIPKKILTEIEQQILPNYFIKEQKQKNMSMLTIISYATAFLSMIPIVNVFSRYLIIFTIFPLIRIIGLDMPKDRRERTKYILNIFHSFALIILFALNTYLGLLLYQQYHYPYRRRDIDLDIILPMTLLIFLFLLVPKVINIHKNRKNK